MRRPRRLRVGDTLGVVAPASPFDETKFRQGLMRIAALGFQTHLPENLFRRNGYLAGSDRERAQLVNDLFRDDAIHGIICARGGFGSMKMLPFLDRDQIRRHPKVFIGFSDICALLAWLVNQCGLICFHGPMVTSLATDEGGNGQALLHAVSTPETICLQAFETILPRSGRVSAPVVGGNLATLCHLVGTPFQPDLVGKILLLEERGESPYRIDRMLSQMQYAGCFEKLAGLVLGAFTECGPREEIDRIFREQFTGGLFPVLGGLDVGHATVNLTMPLGMEATLESDTGRLTYARPATKG